MVFTLVFLSIFALKTNAAGTLLDKPPTTIVSERGGEGVLDLIELLSRWLFGILVALGVIFIIIGAYYFLFSGGGEDNVKKGKNYFIYAIVAVVVGTLSWGIVLLIGDFFDTASGP